MEARRAPVIYYSAGRLGLRKACIRPVAQLLPAKASKPMCTPPVLQRLSTGYLFGKLLIVAMPGTQMSMSILTRPGHIKPEGRGVAGVAGVGLQLTTCPLHSAALQVKRLVYVQLSPWQGLRGFNPLWPYSFTGQSVRHESVLGPSGSDNFVVGLECAADLSFSCLEFW